MSVAQNWVEALQIDPEKLNEWSSLAPEGVPMLVWCLQEGHISAEQYLAWATQHFELPVVRAEYFTEAFDSQTALQLHKAVSAGEREWTPWFFPVEKWENVTLVACVEPPPEFDQPGFRCVLADARLLKDAWYRFMAPPESEALITAPEMPKGMETDQVNTAVKPFKLSLDDLDAGNLFMNKEPDPNELYSPPKEEETKPPVPELSDDDEKSMVAEVFHARQAEEPVDDEVSRMHTHVDLSKLDEATPEPETPRAPTPPIPISQSKSVPKPPPPVRRAARQQTPGGDQAQ